MELQFTFMTHSKIHFPTSHAVHNIYIFKIQYKFFQVNGIKNFDFLLLVVKQFIL